MANRIYSSMYERLVANTVLDDDTQCWLWIGATRNGRGSLTLRVPGKVHPVNVSASRLMLEESTGFYFPFDQCGHWRCFNPQCISPDHLRIETIAENLSTRRGYAPCEGSWIPTLFPTEKAIEEARLDAWLDRAWDGTSAVVALPNEPCPF